MGANGNVLRTGNDCTAPHTTRRAGSNGSPATRDEAAIYGAPDFRFENQIATATPTTITRTRPQPKSIESALVGPRG